MRLVLASESPRRLELLRAAGFELDAIPAHVDESMHVDEEPEAYALRLACAKADAVWPRAGGRPVLGADTVVVVDRTVLGKPADIEDARRMLRLLSGREHVVMTAVCLLYSSEGSGGSGLTGVDRTAVAFAPHTPAEVEWYVASGEPFDKAGGYAIQGLASRFIPRIVGSYSNVVGLPMALVYNLCSRAGLLVS